MSGVLEAQLLATGSAWEPPSGRQHSGPDDGHSLALEPVSKRAAHVAEGPGRCGGAGHLEMGRISGVQGAEEAGAGTARGMSEDTLGQPRPLGPSRPGLAGGVGGKKGKGGREACRDGSQPPLHFGGAG